MHLGSSQREGLGKPEGRIGAGLVCDNDSPTER